MIIHTWQLLVWDKIIEKEGEEMRKGRSLRAAYRLIEAAVKGVQSR